ncbi:MAG: hypothetical protein HYT12_04540 [Candidatus Liptonbacteria bacterium]|nr:hypothetical protein [Candidatus Liptonbacteria bacterium]
MSDNARLVLRFREKLVWGQGVVMVGRVTIPLHLTESTNFVSNSVKMCEGWKLWMKNGDIVILDYNKLVIPIAWDLVESITISRI